ncbi:zf-HC2 domain-containing protein [Viridibacillus sp. NPDC093762]|uniref:zf-HC2 domain-containing protein n=1 Tax=Viridibacillus sp. NPDC093762 TaxID=3390720 RepID=UPI003CFDB016
MNACPKHIGEYMHEYLDGDISREHEIELKAHLQSCDNCRQHMQELNSTIAFVKSAAVVSVPLDFKQNVMIRLPKGKSGVGVQRWLRRHPIFVAAAMFCILMSTSLLTGFNDNKEFSVTKQPNLVVDGQTVIVPAGKTVTGDIVVKNGDILVEGSVDGNITVINGQYMASTANVTGQIDEINQAFEWLWYKIKNGGKEILSFLGKNE